MRRITIEIDGMNCEVELCNGQGTVLAKAGLEMSGPVSWSDLLTTLAAALQLDQHTPPGLLVQGDAKYPSTTSSEPWEAKLCGFGIPGWLYGFWLPGMEESCCGFRTAAAATKGAKFLRHNLDAITGDLPNGVFEIFVLTGTYAFLDLNGDVHASFPRREDAAGCAAKLEGLQMSQIQSRTNPS